MSKNKVKLSKLNNKVNYYNTPITKAILVLVKDLVSESIPLKVAPDLLTSFDQFKENHLIIIYTDFTGKYCLDANTEDIHNWNDGGGVDLLIGELEFIGLLTELYKLKSLEVKLNDEYKAEFDLDNNTFKVGCQVFSFDVIDQLVEAKNKITKE